MEFINNNIKYLYYLVIAFIICLLVVLIVKLVNLSKDLKKATIGINNIEEQIKAINAKCEYLKELYSKRIKLIIEIVAIFTILKAIKDDYKSTPKRKRSLKKSVVKGCVKKYRSLKKIV